MKINKRWVMSFIVTVILSLTGEVTAKDDLLLNAGFKEQVKRGEDKGLVGLWHFDEGKGDKALDSSKRGNHGQIKGAGWVEGISGQALSFNGKDAYVRIPTQGFDYSEVTIEMWVKTDKWDDSSKTLYNMYGGKSGVSYIELNLYQNNLYWIDQGVNEFCITYDTSGISKGNWHHLAATADFNSDSYRLFLDGVEVGSSTTASDAPIVPGTVYIGARYEANVSYYFDGCLDEVKVYNRVLTPDEIISHYTASAAKDQASQYSGAKRDTFRKVMVHEDCIEINLDHNAWVRIFKKGDELFGMPN